MRERRKFDGERRGSAADRGYDAKWRVVRAGHLSAHPLCVAHLANGHVVVATVVDHIRPHKGDMRLFWDPLNRQSLCGDCHRTIKAEVEAEFARSECSLADLDLNRMMPDRFPS